MVAEGRVESPAVAPGGEYVHGCWYAVVFQCLMVACGVGRWYSGIVVAQQQQCGWCIGRYMQLVGVELQHVGITVVLSEQIAY